MLNERDAKFFRPLWIRLLVTAICAAWLVAEYMFSRDQLWMAIAGIATAYCVWNFFIKFPKPAAAPEGDNKP